MKITEFELFQVPPRWLFLKINTDEGLFGWGEPIIEGRAKTVKAAVEELMEYLKGKDPMQIEDHWNVLYHGGFYRGGPILMSAIAGIDQALWDIKGKYFGVPVYQLMGGKVRDKMRVYSWVGGDRPSIMAKAVKDLVKRGFTALKMNATEETHYVDSFKKIEGVVSRVGSVREIVGDDFGIGIDFHGRVHKSMAKVLIKELEPFHPMFVEEPVLPENNEVLKILANSSSIPIATGERMYSRWDYKKLLTDGTADIIQPDLSHAGGITETKKIISMAEAFDVAAAPHCPLGPIALASSLQVGATCHNVFIQEQSLKMHYNKGNDLLDYLKNKNIFKYNNGFVPLPEQPGLGVDIDEDFVRQESKKWKPWRNPVWRNEDGSVAEW